MKKRVFLAAGVAVLSAAVLAAVSYTHLDCLCFTTISIAFPSSLCWGCHGGRIYVPR